MEEYEENANKQLYRKVTGQNTNIERASIDLTKDDSSDVFDILLPPIKLHKCEFGDSSVVLIADKIEDISKQVSGLAESITFMQNMQRSLECVVCKGLVRSPIVFKCCGRVIGCMHCVKRWLDVHATCPHCSSVIEEDFPLKGFDDFISCLQFAMDEKLSTPRGYESCLHLKPAVWIECPYIFIELILAGSPHCCIYHFHQSSLIGCPH